MRSELPKIFFMIYQIIIKDGFLIRVTVAMYIVIVIIKQISFIFSLHIGRNYISLGFIQRFIT